MNSEQSEAQTKLVGNTGEIPVVLEQIEQTEVGLENAIQQAEMGVMSEESRVLQSADERIANAPALSNIEPQKAESIFALGSFGERIQTIKNKITALGNAARQKIVDLFSNEPQVIHFSEMAPVVEPETLPTQTLPEEPREVVTETEVKVETTEQKERREMQEYLEREVFTKFGLTKEEEEKALAEASAERREILARSFENIRGTLLEYFDSEIKGRIDFVNREKATETNQVHILHPYLARKIAQERYLSGFQPEDFGVTTDGIDKNKLFSIHQIIYARSVAIIRTAENEIRAKISSTLDEKGIYLDLDVTQEISSEEYDRKMNTFVDSELRQVIAEKGIDPMFIDVLKGQAEAPEWPVKLEQEVKQLMGTAEDPGPEPYRFPRNREEVLQELEAKFHEVEQTSFLNINITPQNLETMLREGEYKGIFSLEPEVAQKRIGELASGDIAYYLKLRTDIEKALGTHNPEKSVIYGTLGSRNGSDEFHGGAREYGDIFVKLKKGVLGRTLFSEGDSLNPKGFTESVAQKIWNNRLTAKPIEHAKARQITPKHSFLAKSLLDLDVANSKKFKGLDDYSLEYLEAHITGGLKVEDIESINIPRSKLDKADENALKIIANLQADPVWKDRINIIED